MNKHLLAAVLLLMVSQHLMAQEIQRKMIYSLGAGPAIEGDIGMWAINISNDLSYYLNDRISINPNLTYFHTIADFGASAAERKEFRQDYASSLFAGIKIKADILKTERDFRIGIAAGPSFQLGGTSYHQGFATDEDRNLISTGYRVEKHARLGYTTQVVFDWKSPNPNRRTSAAISMSSFSGYWPYYLMATYSLGFQLKK